MQVPKPWDEQRRYHGEPTSADALVLCLQLFSFGREVPDPLLSFFCLKFSIPKICAS